MESCVQIARSIFLRVQQRSDVGEERAGAAKGEGGSATLEMVLAAPVLALCLLLIVQFGVWSHALHVASAAAQEGARAARVENGSEQAGEQRARDLLNQVGKQVLVSPTVTACRNDQVAKVEVRGKAVSIVPGLPLPVHAVSTGPVERFRSVKESPSDRAATC